MLCDKDAMAWVFPVSSWSQTKASKDVRGSDARTAPQKELRLAISEIATTTAAVKRTFTASCHISVTPNARAHRRRESEANEGTRARRARASEWSAMLGHGGPRLDPEPFQRPLCLPAGATSLRLPDIASQLAANRGAEPGDLWITTPAKKFRSQPLQLLKTKCLCFHRGPTPRFRARRREAAASTLELLVGPHSARP